MMMRVLLHVCCGPCATSSILSLMKDYDVTCYFYNPCIEPKDEYDKRLRHLVAVCEQLGVDYVIGDYDNDLFRKMVKGLENEEEGGLRCMKCYEQRLRKTMEYALKNRFKLFTTTLTISPHKSSRIIFEIGKRLAMDKNIDFLQRDFKKKGGFNASVRMRV